ncbi:hypothetical protein, partial [Pantoea agglomerans]|uniref:hypothetical protein n=1 Tax=Enterobacter agglomerans TaxID=549 RepID=UPI001A8F7673
NLRWNSHVEYVSYDETAGVYQLQVTDTRNGQKQNYLARHLCNADRENRVPGWQKPPAGSIAPVCRRRALRCGAALSIWRL